MKLTLPGLILGLSLFGVVQTNAQTNARPRSQSKACDANAVALSLAPLGSKVRRQIVTAVARTLSDSMPDRQTARDLALNSWASYPRLSPTDTAIVITAGPDNPNNGVFNRQIWVFRVAGRRAELVLEDWASMCDYDPASFHNGMVDLQLRSNSRAKGSMTIFQFDGRQYRPLR